MFAQTIFTLLQSVVYSLAFAAYMYLAAVGLRLSAHYGFVDLFALGVVMAVGLVFGLVRAVHRLRESK